VAATRRLNLRAAAPVAVVLVLLLAGRPGDVRAAAFRPYPDLAKWFVGGLPWGVPDAPAAVGSRVRWESEYALGFRERRHDGSHDYERGRTQLLWVRRAERSWTGLRGAIDVTDAANANTFTDDDRMHAYRRTRSLWASGGWQADHWQVAAALGRSRAWEGAFRGGARGAWGAADLTLGAANLEWTLEQTVASFRYDFAFPFRREHADVGYRPPWRWAPALRATRDRDIATAGSSAGDVNEFDAAYWGGAIAWEDLGGGARVDVEGSTGRLGLDMRADGIAFLHLEDVALQRLAIWTVSPRGPTGLQARAGWERWRLQTDAGYFLPFPFGPWGMFADDRYLLKDLDVYADIYSLGLERTPAGDAAGVSTRVLVRLLDDQGDVAWKKGHWLLFPILMGWTPRSATSDVDSPGWVQVDLGWDVDLSSRWRLEVGATQVVPLPAHRDGGRAPAVPGPPSPPTWSYGGLGVQLAVVWRG
jgi:hypothetical protein